MNNEIEIKGLPEAIAIGAVCLLLLTYCAPAPAQELRDTMRPDPYYSRYPFQSPAQASRQLDAEREASRYQDRQLDAIDAAARRIEQAADQRDFQRRLDAIYGR